MDNNKSAEEWFSDLVREGENDPDSLTDELLLDVTEQLYVRMTELGLRPTDLAERLGVSRAYVSQLLNGRPNMTMRTLVGIAHALDEHVRVELQPKAAARWSPDAYCVPVRVVVPEDRNAFALAA